jgi:DENN (AEX-3) domain
MDLDFAAPLRCLSVDRLLAVFALMLRESKMVFLCCSNTLLTETMETLRSLLFPLKWSSCFVSRLPDALSGLLEAPGGFMIGLHMFEDRDNDVEVAESHVNKHFGNRKAVRQTKWTHSLTAGTFIVDLSSNALFQYDGKSVQTPLGTSALTNLVHSLPPGPRKRLQKKLQHIATSYCIGPQTVGLDRFDSAFDFQAYEDVQEPALVTALSWESFPTLEIRDCFMNFMADLLGNYQKYIIPPLEDMSADTYRTFKEEFSVEEYLNDAGPTVRSILELVVETQMFAVLLQQRSEASDYSLVFFESAGELMREYKLQAGGHNFKDVSASFSASSSIPDMVAPLYKLLAAKAWAAANGKYYHINDNDKDQMHDNSESPKSSKESSGQSTPPEFKPEEKKYFASLRTPSNTRRTVAGSPSFVRKDVSKAVKVLTPLDCLVIALDEMEAEATKTPFNEGVVATPRRRGKVGSRNELDRRVNLRLHDRSLGPLIIPGPSKSLLNTTLPHGISACRRHINHDLLSSDRVDDTNSVVTCSTDVSDDDSVSLPIYSKAIAEFGVSSPVSNGEANYLMAMVALRSEQNSTTLQTEESNEIEYESDVERDSEGRFTYQIGWPVLHSKLLKLARRSVHTRLSGLRKSRVFALQMVRSFLYLHLSSQILKDLVC